MKRIVCDTGPLLHLFEANLLNLLEAAGEVLMPVNPTIKEQILSDLDQLSPEQQVRAAEFVHSTESVSVLL